MSEGTNGSKPTPKALALIAIVDAKVESERTNGPRPPVLAALLREAEVRVLAIQELVRARRAKVAK